VTKSGSSVAAYGLDRLVVFAQPAFAISRAVVANAHPVFDPRLHKLPKTAYGGGSSAAADGGQAEKGEREDDPATHNGFHFSIRGRNVRLCAGRSLCRHDLASNDVHVRV
jgi:hypothetical protein